MRLRLLAFAFTASVSLAAAPSARADPAAIYPLGTLRAGPEDVSDVRALLDAALHRAERRGGLAPAGQPARAACGPATAAEAACLARLAGAGVVLLGVVERAGSTLVVALRAVDGQGRVYGPVTAAVDVYVQNAEVLVQALSTLDDLRHGAALPAPSLRAAPPPAPRSLEAARPPSTSPATGGSGGAWRVGAGRWTTAAGVGLLAAGAVTAALNRQLAADLEDRYGRSQLEPGDAARYRTVDTYNSVSVALLAAGGVATAAGIVLWATAPDVRPVRGGATFGVSGHF